MRKGLATAALAAAILMGLPMPGRAGVSVNIGINLPAPPPLIQVPGLPVMYADTTPANYFSYAGQYYVFTGGVWYVSGGYNGPWVALAPEFVPRPILGVPVRFYHVRPPAWRGWRVEAAPRLDARWGRRWAGEHRPARVVRRDRHDRREHREHER